MVGRPVMHLSATQQATGEARYIYIYIYNYIYSLSRDFWPIRSLEIRTLNHVKHGWGNKAQLWIVQPFSPLLCSCRHRYWMYFERKAHKATLFWPFETATRVRVDVHLVAPYWPVDWAETWPNYIPHKVTLGSYYEGNKRTRLRSREVIKHLAAPCALLFS